MARLSWHEGKTVLRRAVPRQDDALLAYQIGFDLFENEMQSFLLQVRTSAVYRFTLMLSHVSHSVARLQVAHLTLLGSGSFTRSRRTHVDAYTGRVCR